MTTPTETPVSDALVAEIERCLAAVAGDQVVSKERAMDLLLDVRLAGGDVALVDAALGDLSQRGAVEGTWLASELARLRDAAAAN